MGEQKRREASPEYQQETMARFMGSAAATIENALKAITAPGYSMGFALFIFPVDDPEQNCAMVSNAPTAKVEAVLSHYIAETSVEAVDGMHEQAKEVQ